VNRGVAGAIGGLLGLAALAAWAIAGPDDKAAKPPPAADRPQLALLTSLPLIFGESFGLDGGGSPALARLEQRYQVTAIGVADAASLKGQRLLLMAHPRAQPAEVLVELDQWVRGGGHVLLLADPRLNWPSERSLGDKLRPPPAFADTGLLKHWGLTLTGPHPDGPATRLGGDAQVLTSAPGRLEAGPSCAADEEGFVARCAIGKGRATVIADADFLNVDGPGALDGPTAQNLDLLIDELTRLDSR
jgi:hypothetical protein